MFFKALISTLFVSVFLAGTTNATPIAKSGPFSGNATFFYPSSPPGACGVISVDTDHIVALSPSEFGDGTHCFQHIRAQFNGKSVDATVVDLCFDCRNGTIDLSPSAFGELSDLSVGILHGVTWDFQ
ncbi:Allergen Asp f 7 [Grifola frondosa]|uniref:Allergen Asp f 7 n=1 Tax=Grifola frondosa TaxID=5627 RepID=A0A1C7MAM9_GRIFR|nr:Allergen Asp f 7 [Grifola frondosa]